VPSVQFNVAQQQIVANGRDAKQPNLVSPTPPEAFPMAPAATEKDQKPMLTKRSKQPNSSRRGDA